ncbi:MAG: gliding motility-associated C-terminal domain-containing protein [Bacteroidota bacterium]
MKFNFYLLLFLLWFINIDKAISQVVLNEVMVRPAGGVGTPPNGLIYIGSLEYIELYNNGCTPLDVSGYFIAMRQEFSGQGSGGTFRIPNVPQAVIPPKQHIVLGSGSPGATIPATDIDIVMNLANSCLYTGGNFVLSNIDGWCGLYNASGVPIDAIYWSGAAGNINTQSADYGGTLCLPSTTPASVTSLPNAQQINSGFPGVMQYVGGNFTTGGSPLSRQPDGGAWGRTLASSISAVGNCNGGTCYTPPAATTGFSYTSPSCNSGSANPTTVSGFTAGGTYTAPTGVVINATTGAIDLAASTPGGPYTITYTVTGGVCSAAGSGTTNIVIQNCCPTITNPNTVAAICPGADLPPVSVSTTTTGPNSIRFVYFNAPQTVANNIYAGINTLGTATPLSGTATYDGSNVGLAGSLPNTPGTYYIYAILNPTPTDATCRPFQEIVVTISALPTTPTASVTVQPTCAAPTGTIVITAPVGSNFEYSINGTTYQAGTTFSNLSPGSYNITVRNTTTGCVSLATPLTVNAIPGAPAAPTASVTLQPTCTTPTGTIVITAPLGSNFEYSINGTTYQAGTTFSALAPNNYNVTVRNTTTGCVSSPTVLTVNPVPAPPATPTASVTVQPTCTTPTGTIVITAPTGANLEYSINGSTYQAGTTFSALAPNNYNVTVRNTTTGCVSSPTVLTVNPVPSPPATPTASVTLQPTCTTPTGTIVITAPTGANLEYSINGSTYQAGTTFNAVVPNTYNVTVRNTTTGCVSSATSLTVNAAPGTPATPVASVTVQPTCTTPTGTIVITAPIGANLEYSINGSTYQASTLFSGLTPNTSYTVTVRNTTSGCTAVSTALLVNPVPALPAAPTASVTVQPTCTTPTGTIVITAPTGANLEYSINGTSYQASTTFSALTPNTYNVTVRNSSNGCVSTATSLTVDPVPAPPVAPTISVTQPNCTTPTGSIVIANPTGSNLEYSINGTTYQASDTFSGLVPNSYNVTVRNTTTGCISSAIAQTINVAPGTPNTPVANVTVQPTCTVPTGTILISSPTGANLEYSINGSTYQVATSFVNVAPGTYNVTVRNTTAGCVSAPTSVTVNNIPLPPAVPSANVTVQPTCTVPTGTLVITTPIGANFEYSVNGTTYQTSTTFSGLLPGNYALTVRNTSDGCISSPAGITVFPIPNPPATPTASVTVQPTCINPSGTIVITAPVGSNLQYNINGGTYQSGTSFTGLNPGIYAITVRNAVSGCISFPLPLVVNALPTAPPTPTLSLIQPSCTSLTGTINITNPSGPNYQYSINTFNYQTGNSFSGLIANSYNVTVRDVTTGCVSVPAVAVITPAPPISPLPTLPTTTEYCKGDRNAAPLTAGGINLLWYNNQGGGTGSSTAPTPNTNITGLQTFYVTQTLPGACESDRIALVVRIKNLPVVNAGPDKNINIGESVQIQGTALGLGVNILWSPSATLINANTATPVAKPSLTTTYTITVLSNENCSASDSMTVIVFEPINIPNAFSPNGDGFNDVWIIDKLEQYPNAVVEIYNRYGKKIFERKGYNRSNAWDGTNNGSPLPVAPYYYILRLGNGTKPMAGVISIIR